MAFVTRSGSQFMLSGKRFRFVGANNYPLVQNSPAYTSTQLDAFFAYCKQDNITVVRTWCFNRKPTDGNATGNFQYISGTTLFWNEATFQQLDLVLDRAAAAGIRLILVLSDEYPQFSNDGNKQQYCSWNNTINATAYDAFNYGDDFHLDANIISTFKGFIAKLCARVNTVNGKTYSADDTIFSWQMMNEGRFNSGTDTNPDTLASYRYTTMKTWYTTISAYIKSLDSNHLVGTGSVAQFYDNVAGDSIHNGTFYGLDYTQDHLLANVDYFDFHLYVYGGPAAYTLNAYGQSLGFPSTATAAGLQAQVNQFVGLAKQNSKPVICGEWGVVKANSLNSLYVSYPRSVHFDKALNEFFSRDGDGFIVWHYTQLFDDASYNVLPGSLHTGGNANNNLNDDDTGLRAVMMAYAYQISNRRTPVV